MDDRAACPGHGKGASMRNLLCSVAVLAASALSSGAGAGASDAPAGAAADFGRLFTHTCLAAFGDPGKVEPFMESNGLAPLPGDTAQRFLMGKAGKAWSISLGSGDYAVAQTDDGLCVVFARQAQPDAFVAEFQRLLKSMPAPLQVNEVKALGPNRDGTHTRSWGVNAPDARTGILFTLTTSTEPDMPLQAMASMARVATAEFIPAAAPKKH
ncbi:hypothetical protein [Stenotrophomonas sp.]|uniref:NMCC_0638 family (lipo)protein n=1 Tax=Stenotrophomonas sp. TaxID=69392 RepID=UPI0028A2BC3A|nr:hypothetical protein [Stenotrophomonas sp.]